MSSGARNTPVTTAAEPHRSNPIYEFCLLIAVPNYCPGLFPELDEPGDALPGNPGVVLFPRPCCDCELLPGLTPGFPSPDWPRLDSYPPGDVAAPVAEPGVIPKCV